jgi:hypothetical protein
MPRALYEDSTDEVFTTAVEDLRELIAEALTGREAIKAIEKMFKQEGLKGLQVWSQSQHGTRSIVVKLHEGGELEFPVKLQRCVLL